MKMDAGMDQILKSDKEPLKMDTEWTIQNM
jgi:hypothetical protein